MTKEEPKQETLEEAAERFAETYFNKNETSMRTSTLSFKDGAKWQAERMYSEEECYKTLHNLMTDIKLQGLIIADDIDLKKWFDYNKKKSVV
jgi:hypothetical protein